jgi:nitric oxide reductase subunit C
MLSKSQARAFFVVGTGLCTAAFVGLTIDTFRRIPGQTRQNEITAETIRGKELWDSNNCMGCHTLFGEGGYYAPELTKVYERRGEPFIRRMLTDPEAMYPGQRRMQKYDFSEADKSALVTFLKWAGRVDLNGFPAKPKLMPVAVPVQTGPAIARSEDRPQVFNQLCIACHSLEGQGGSVGPALDGVALRRNSDYLRRWLHDPTKVKPDSRMPNLGLADATVNELVAFLETKK